MRPPSASAKSRILLLLTSILLCLGLVELGLRVRTHVLNRTAFEAVFSSEALPPGFRGGELKLAGLIRPAVNPKIIYELRPGLSGSFWGARLTINEHGFRSRSLDVAKPAGAVRVLGLGDSFMFGLGVSDDETYLDTLEGLLNEGPEPIDWQVINTAVPGYNTVMEVETLRERGLEYSPDHVVIEFVSNDTALPNFIRSKTSPFARRFFIGNYWRDRRRRGRLHPLMQVLRRGGLSSAPNDESGRNFESDPGEVPPEYRSMVGWDAYVTAMEDLRDLRAEGAFDVVLLSVTTGRGRLKMRAFELGTALGFSVVDVGPALEGYMQDNGIDRYLGSVLSLSETNGHPSAVAHEIAARELYAHLLAKGRPESPRLPVLELKVGEGAVLETHEGQGNRNQDSQGGREE
jgi:hypothetical protein